jgi:hypothetical protein
MSGDRTQLAGGDETGDLGIVDGEDGGRRLELQGRR